MSTLAGQRERAAPGLAARRSAARRLRRADDGALTEMARSLLRDARRSGDAEPQDGGGAARLEPKARGSREAFAEVA
ncbi:MAG TPA: hypothetical protein VGO14_07170 [Solirubrobacteraceae bacterium]|jgi:hypothetical protein|nr:hypothetical protein [Solirubrobacteraceae bacterium]